MSIKVDIRDVSRSFGTRPAVRGLTRVFAPGLVHAVIGPNGSGKSTLLRMVARLDTPDAGAITYSDAQGGIAPDIRLMRRMTLVSQAPALFNTTIFENVAYGLRVRGLAKELVSDRVHEALAEAGLAHLSHARAETLSGGEAQRAAFARAYAIRPELVLLDEPTANLDPDGVALMEGLVKRMSKGHGATVIVVTHNLFQARRIADMVHFMYAGGLVESGENPGFFDHPSEPLTREFISGEAVY